MARLLYLIAVIVGSFALVGGAMMIAVGLLLFVGSNLFPAVANVGVQDLQSFVLVGGVTGIIGWAILSLLTRGEPTNATCDRDSDSDLLGARHK